MTASGLEVQLLLRAGAELVADIERTMREGGKAPVHNILPARLKALHTERYDNFPVLIDGLG